MTEVKGDIWTFHEWGQPIVVPTNGSVNARGECVMGRGVALQAARKFPSLPRDLGARIQLTDDLRVLRFIQLNLFAFPVKFNWREAADLKLIERSACQLAMILDDLAENRANAPQTVYLPRVGCGNGRLLWKNVKPVLVRHLDDRFTVVQLEMP